MQQIVVPVDDKAEKLYVKWEEEVTMRCTRLLQIDWEQVKKEVNEFSNMHLLNLQLQISEIMTQKGFQVQWLDGQAKVMDTKELYDRAKCVPKYKIGFLIEDKYGITMKKKEALDYVNEMLLETKNNSGTLFLLLFIQGKFWELCFCLV